MTRRQRRPAGPPAATFGDWIGRAADRRSVSDVLADYSNEHGRHAARDLAEALGISPRQARRYIAGTVRRPPADRLDRIRAAVPTGSRAARTIRDADVIHAGTVPVVSKSDGTAAGTRTIGTRAITGPMRDLFDAAADALEAGDAAAAEELLSNGLMTYGGRDTGNYIGVADFDGIELE